jgi:hypothetical protein
MLVIALMPVFFSPTANPLKFHWDLFWAAWTVGMIFFFVSYLLSRAFQLYVNFTR